MNILVTGAKGFVGCNLCAELCNIRDGKAKNSSLADHPLEVYEYDIDTPPALLDEFCQKADFVFNLAGVNRPLDPKEFMEGNFGFASTLLDTLKKYGNTCPVMIASSTQAELSNPYGESKREGEELMRRYSKETGAPVLIYRFPNLFGKWCRPNYNSAIATFCHHIARDLTITVNDPTVTLNLVYIDDLVEELIAALSGKEHHQGDFCVVPVVHRVSLGRIVELIRSFKASREDLSITDMSDAFAKKLYSTYLSYLPEDQFSYPLKMNVDHRGSFTEMIRTPDRGQVSVNISKPHIVKGQHWHHSKNEKFLVVSGTGVIRFRRLDSDHVFEYFVNGNKLEVVDIPTGYTHNIENLGNTDMVTLMWCNEPFDPQKPDTYYLEV